MEIKDTLLMPQTEFNMRGNLGENEEIQQKEWDKIDVYNKAIKRNEGKPTFVLHDGPPYANNNIHLGHAFQKILKDFINRHKMMSGYQVIFIPGWDTHGLPVETAVTNSGVNRKELSKAEYRKLCYEYAVKQVELQKADFKRLSCIADWEHPYHTYDKEYEAKQIEVFGKMADRGLIFKGLKPVYWSPSSESALAEAEIEYQDRKDPSIFVAFPVVEGNDKVNEGEHLVIWTTTPWTLPGNLAIAVGEQFDYVKVEANDKVYVLAESFLEELAKEFEWEDYKVLDKFKGSELVGLSYRHTFMDRISPVVPGFHVSLDAGTGLVHIAPGYGVEDFQIGREFDLGMVNGVNDQGFLNEESGIFKDLFFEDANKEVTKWLDENGYLLKLKFITHSYPHDWRTKKPIIFRATSQWFCSIEPIRSELIRILDEEVEFKTEWGYTRIYNMIKDRGDWCISRQRTWGVPIPIFYNEDGSEIIDKDVINHVASLFREFGSNVWFERDAKDLLPDGYTNPASPNGNFTKEEDTMDVWFDSGTSWAGVLLERGLSYPSDIYLEGSDQYRGWFNSSLICSVAAEGKSPYKKLISTGFVVDQNGLKMSKSLGNVVRPMDVVRLHGSELLRLWTASVDYEEDVRFGDDIFAGVKESYRKIRNTYRFMLGNLFDFDPNKDKISFEDMNDYNKYMMVKLDVVKKNILKAYDEFSYPEIYKTINHYLTFDLSTFYLDFIKDILYIEGKDSNIRRQVQSVLYEILSNLISLLAPILPYTSEEVYKLIPGEKEESIHLTDMPEIINYSNEQEILDFWSKFLLIKDDVYKALEIARNDKVIGKGLEARVFINAQGEYLDVLNELKDYLKQLFIVSDVVITTDDLEKFEVVEVKIERHEGIKCERCWNYFEEDEIENEVCHRCADVMSHMN